MRRHKLTISQKEFEYLKFDYIEAVSIYDVEACGLLETKFLRIAYSTAKGWVKLWSNDR